MADIENIMKNVEKFNLTQGQYDELTKKITMLTIKQQDTNDILKGGLRSANLKEYRNTYVINAQDSLDADFPMYVHFNIISEMTKIVSIKLSFWFENFRAYSKAGVAAGTPSGGGDTSGAAGTPSGGGDTSGIVGDLSHLTTKVYNVGGVDYLTLNTGDACAGRLYTYAASGPYILERHTHSTPAHTHPDHTHSTPAHTHPDHTHPAVYGIFEEETSPTIMPSISRDNGLTYSLPIGSYTKDQSLDITRFIENAGSKIIKFESNARARLSVQIEIKLDIRARS